MSRDKIFQKLKKSNLHIDKEFFFKKKEAKYQALKLIATKNQGFLKKGSQKALVSQKSYGVPLNIQVYQIKL